ncbi:hypothetical protein GCM10027038_18900 [Arthrobacter bambusae]
MRGRHNGRPTLDDQGVDAYLERDKGNEQDRRLGVLSQKEEYTQHKGQGRGYYDRSYQAADNEGLYPGRFKPY